MPIDIVVMKAVNAENKARAKEVCAQLTERGILGLNFMSSPGSGKTSLLEETIKRLAGELSFAVIEGDVFTAMDAERIAQHGVEVIQLNTEGSCHLTAHMIVEVLPKLKLDGIDILAIENIGNLICPTSYDLGEHKRVACLSTTEGADKVDKYPKLFSISHVNLLTKADLAPHVNFDLDEVAAKLAKLNTAAPVITTSVNTGEGLDAWCDWLRQARREAAKS